MWGVITPQKAEAKIRQQREAAGITEPQNLEEKAISLVGTDIYERLVKTLPYVQKLHYRNTDLYRYWIGRPDQSVQQNVMSKRYSHQILVMEKCFISCHLDRVSPRHLKRYMEHELFMMFGISILFTRLNKSTESDAALEKMWETCFAFDPKWAKHFRKHSPLWFICLPGTFGQNFSGLIYRLANKVVRFNYWDMRKPLWGTLLKTELRCVHMAVSHRGAISFGMVHIPVGLYTATQDKDIHFNQLC